MKNRNTAHSWVLGLRDIDKTQSGLAGGKGANLGELAKIEGIRVPDGFCVSTEAFQRIIGETPAIGGLLERLSLLKVTERDEIRALGNEIRRTIETTAIPPDMRAEITQFLSGSGEECAYAVRSSATAEDLPTASFAGQQDTHLNVCGNGNVLAHIRKCWASLYTERAILYRLQNGFDHRQVQLAVVVQQMIFPQAAGIAFTADPVTSDRKVLAIDAGFGLGEALVSGRVNADRYKVRDGEIIDKKISDKEREMYAADEGGTKERVLGPGQRNKQVLTDEQILELGRTGRKIEAHFGCPQDIEWCLADDVLYIVQSRPVTTLYPVPEAGDSGNHVYISVGHQQMMTDAMKPLGLSFWQLTASRPMYAAGGRLFVDITQELASPARETMVNVLGKADPLLKDALTTILERRDFIRPLPESTEKPAAGQSKAMSPAAFQTQLEYDPAVVPDLIGNSRAALEELKNRIRTKSGPELIDLILEDIRQLKEFITDPKSFGVIMTAMNAASWINSKMEEWLGEKNAADTLSQSVPDNITSEMGLALLDVADAVRPYPEVVAYLQQAKDDGFPDTLVRLEGGRESRDAIHAFLEKYGMRCAGEIDITKPRWSEKPATLIPLILGNVKNFGPGEGSRRFGQGLEEALKKEQELLERLEQLPEGGQKAEETKRMIGLVRNFSGYREYPKYAIVSRYFVYKQALLREAERLVRAGVIASPEDLYYLTFEELGEVLRTGRIDQEIIGERRHRHRLHEKLVPPRVLTSDGEIVAGKYNREDLPAGAIAGLAVSSGITEGRARVVLNIEDAGLEDGDILVTAFTDPSWTPLFLSIKGLVTEVGGLMTHGAVIAREYGLPAVVGVEHATRLIRDGQRIRVNGTEGYVEILGAGAQIAGWKSCAILAYRLRMHRFLTIPIMNIFFTLFVATAAVATSYAQSPRQELPPPGGRTNLPFPTHFPTVFNPSNGSEAAAPDYDQLVATGDYYLNQKRYGEAIDHYNKALAQRPEQYPKDQILRAKALQAHEEKEMALRTGEEKKAEAARIPQTEFVPRILENNRWKNAALVCDVTGSMGTYNDQVLNWIAKLLSASDTAVRRVVLFNDKDKRKKIGQDPATAAGLHSFRPVTYEHAKEQVRTAAAESSGGDVYENNITALLRAQLDCPSCEQLIMINDNNRPWDFSRASEVTKPVHIIVCGPPAALEDCYLNLARMTKGSVHFNGRSYTGLETYAEGASLKVDNTTYVVEKGEFVRKH